LIHLQH